VVGQKNWLDEINRWRDVVGGGEPVDEELLVFKYIKSRDRYKYKIRNRYKYRYRDRCAGRRRS